MNNKKILLLTLLACLAAPVIAAPPIANNDIRTIPRNVPVSINVLSNDSDPDGDGINVIAQSVTQPQVGGTVTLNPDGGIYFVPTRDFVGTDIRFTYSIQDDSGQAETSDIAVVIINIVPGNLSENLVIDNQLSVGQALDQICNSLAGTSVADVGVGRAALVANCEILLALEVQNPEEATRAVRQIAPEEALTLAKLGANASELQQDIVSNRLAQIGQGAASGFTARGRVGWSSQLDGGAAGDESSLLAKIGLFASVQLEDADKKVTAAEAGFDYQANAFTAGMDYAFSSAWFMGSAIGWTGNQLDYKDNGGGIDSDIINLIAYSSYHRNNFSFDGQLGFGNSKIDLVRTIHYGELGNEFNAQAKGETSGNEWFLSVQSQYLWNRAAWTIYPRAALNYSSSTINGYAETQAGGWDVILSDQTVNRWSIEAGLQLTYAVSTNWGVIVPNVDFTLISDLNTDQKVVTGTFAYAPVNSAFFALGAEEPDALYYQVGAGFSAVLPHGISAFAGYRQTLGYTDFTSNQIELGIRADI